MSLAPGTRLGTYQVVGPLGAGGMGEVYRASDSRLGRDVALKILPEAFADDPDRLARFEREAKTLASLNHPHVAQVYGFEQFGSAFVLVMELIEGENLADVIARGPLAPAHALTIARQIAAALDAAHERGIVHRDLKPANVRLTPDAVVKVLDFGLAKAVARDEGAGGKSLTPTVADTREGVVVGTAAYMSPEQARGQFVDKRTDVWAFGCLFYEMLAGRSPFAAETVSDTIARVLATDPDWSRLPASTPAGVERLIRRCLERDAKRRLRDLGDLDLALEHAAPLTGSQAPRRSWWWAAALVAGVVATALGTLTLGGLREPPAPAAALVRFEMATSFLNTTGAFSVSPDGRRMIFSGVGEDGVQRMWVRTFDSLDIRPLAGSEGEVAFNTPSAFWSPDGRFIGFYADGKVKTMDSRGGSARAICTVPGVSVGGTWNRDDVIVVGNTSGGLLQCPASGGTATPLTLSIVDPNFLHLAPVFLPDGRHLLYLRLSRSMPAESGLYVADLQLPPEKQSNDRVLETGFVAAYVPQTAASGQILFVKDRAVWAVPFDHNQRTLTGSPVQVAAPVGTFRDTAFFSASPDVLVHRGDVPDLQLSWKDRSGRDLARVGEPGAYLGLAVSSDQSTVALLREARINRADQDIWLLDVNRETSSRLTAGPMLESVPAWSPDSRELIFALGHGDGDIVAVSTTGAATRRLLPRGSKPEFSVNPLLTSTSVSGDGRYLLFSVASRDGTQADIWVMSLQQPDRLAPLVRRAFDQSQGVISPDGRWLAYVSNESGASQVVVAPLTVNAATGLPESGTDVVVSRAGGVGPLWRRDSRELYFHSPAGSVMAVRLTGAAIDRPVELFRAPGMLPQWGVAPDGQRFLVALPLKPNAQVPFGVVLNWQTALLPPAPGR